MVRSGEGGDIDDEQTGVTEFEEREGSRMDGSGGREGVTDQ